MSFFRATPSEAMALSAVHARAFDRPWPAQEFAGMLARHDHCVWASGRHDRVSAFVLIRQSGPEAEILTLATDPAFRRRGLARGLIRIVLSDLSATGVENLFLEVAVDNDAAIALYQGLGFETAGRRKAYYDRGGGVYVDAHILMHVIKPRMNPAETVSSGETTRKL